MYNRFNTILAWTDGQRETDGRTEILNQHRVGMLMLDKN